MVRGKGRGGQFSELSTCICLCNYYVFIHVYVYIELSMFVFTTPLTGVWGDTLNYY